MAFERLQAGVFFIMTILLAHFIGLTSTLVLPVNDTLSKSQCPRSSPDTAQQSPEMAQCPRPASPSERPHGPHPVLFYTNPKIFGIRVQGFYDPLHKYLCADSWSWNNIQLSHTASDIYFFDWEYCREVKVWVIKHPEYHGQLHFYWPSKEAYDRRTFILGVSGVFWAHYLDTLVWISPSKEAGPEVYNLTTNLRSEVVPTMIDR